MRIRDRGPVPMVGTLAVAVGVALSSGAGGLAGQMGVRGGPRHEGVAPPPARGASMAERPVTMAERHVAMLDRRLGLGLDEAQIERLRSVFADHFRAMEAIHRFRGSAGPDAMRAQMTALWRGTDSRVAEILTPEQNVQYDAWRATRGPGARGGMSGGTGMRRGPPGR